MFKKIKSLVDGLIGNKHDLVRQLDRKEITEDEFNVKVKDISEQINNETRITINEKENKQKERIKMDEQKPKVEEPKKERQQKDSVATAIATALALKSIKNIDEAAAKVLELKPGKDAKKVKAQISVIIKETIKGKGRWKNYTWDADKYLLTEK